MTDLTESRNSAGFQQRGTQNSVKHLRWSFLRKYLTAKNHSLFSQKALSYGFDRLLNSSLVWVGSL